MDWYAISAVDRAASPQEIRQAYRRAVLKYHPDKNAEATAEQFDLVSRAYRVLSTPELREQYDRSTQRQSKFDPVQEQLKESFRVKLTTQEKRASEEYNAEKLKALRAENESRISELQQQLSAKRAQQPQFRTLQTGQQFSSVWEARKFLDEHTTEDSPLRMQDSLMETEYSEDYEINTINRLP